MVGSHRGDSLPLNVWNPQATFIYSWGLNTRKGLTRARMRGSQIVQGDDPELAAYRAAVGIGDGSELDSGNIFGDVILLRTPEHRVRTRREEEMRQASTLLRDGHLEYEAKVTATEREYSQKDQGRPTRLVMREMGHGHTLEGPEGMQYPLDWTPDQGIVRR